MNIEFLWFDDCPNHHDARALLRAVLSEMLVERGIEASIEDINVADIETGERVKFPGSPTIRIDGVDVEPGYVDDGGYTPRCRLYGTADGLRGVPERARIERAIDLALNTAA